MPILRDPTFVDRADVLICESTYGDRLHETYVGSEKELERREMAQMPIEEKKRRADVVIINDDGLEKVARQVQAALEQWNVIC